MCCSARGTAHRQIFFILFKVLGSNVSLSPWRKINGFFLFLLSFYNAVFLIWNMCFLCVPMVRGIFFCSAVVFPWRRDVFFDGRKFMVGRFFYKWCSKKMNWIMRKYQWKVFINEEWQKVEWTPVLVETWFHIRGKLLSCWKNGIKVGWKFVTEYLIVGWVWYEEKNCVYSNCWIPVTKQINENVLPFLFRAYGKFFH